MIEIFKETDEEFEKIMKEAQEIIDKYKQSK